MFKSEVFGPQNPAKFWGKPRKFRYIKKKNIGENPEISWILKSIEISDKSPNFWGKISGNNPIFLTLDDDVRCVKNDANQFISEIPG